MLTRMCDSLGGIIAAQAKFVCRPDSERLTGHTTFGHACACWCLDVSTCRSCLCAVYAQMQVFDPDQAYNNSSFVKHTPLQTNTCELPLCTLYITATDNEEESSELSNALKGHRLKQWTCSKLSVEYSVWQGHGTSGYQTISLMHCI